MPDKDVIKVMITDLHDALLVYGKVNKMGKASIIVDFDLEDDDNTLYQGPRSEVKGYVSSTDEKMDVLYLGRQVLVKVLDNQRGVLIYKGTITYSLTGVVHIENLSFVENVQRRNNVKVKVLFKAEVYPIDITDLGFGEVIRKDLEKKKAVLFQDISAGGCCFYCKSKLSLDPLYQFNFTKTNHPFEISFRILRCTEITPDKEWSYGCQFQRMTARDEMLLRQYVFSEIAASKKK